MGQRTTIVTTRTDGIRATVRVPLSDIIGLLKSRGFKPPCDDYTALCDGTSLTIEFQTADAQPAAIMYECPLHPYEADLGSPPEVVRPGEVDDSAPDLDMPDWSGASQQADAENDDRKL